MPNPTMDKLTGAATDVQTQDAISKEIEACMQKPGADQKQCAAMAYSMAREKTGKELNYGK